MILPKPKILTTVVVDTKIDIEEPIFHFPHTSGKLSIANTEKRFHIVNLENGQDLSTKHFSFLMDAIEIQKSQVGAKVKESVAKTKIQEPWVGVEIQELMAKTEIQETLDATKIQGVEVVTKIKDSFVRTKICTSRASTKIKDLKQNIEIPKLVEITKFCELAKVTDIPKSTKIIEILESIERTKIPKSMESIEIPKMTQTYLYAMTYIERNANLEDTQKVNTKF